MDFRILGPFEVAVGDRLVGLKGVRQRLLLARLVVEANRVVAVDTLLDELWGSCASSAARGALQAQVSRVRKALGDPARLISRTPGYVLHLDADELDAARFEALVDRARAHSSKGDIASASAVLGEAELLWRGPALAEFADHDFARAEGVRLEQLRLGAIEERLEVDLKLRRHHRLVPELEGLVAAHPLRERLWGHLMLALYRSGRQSEALRAFGQLRRHLGEELGIDPSPELVLLEESILLHEPGLDLAAVATTHELAPSQPERSLVLPAARNAAIASAASQASSRQTGLIGRRTELTELVTALDEAADDARFVVIEGEPGIGKTRLADELRRVAEDRGALVLWGRSDEGGAAPALWPWLPPLRAVAARAGAVPAALAELLDGEVSTGAGQAQAVQFERFEAVAEVLSGVAGRQPVLVLLDDLQWADATSLELLGFLTTRLGPGVLVVATVRRLEVGRNDAVTDALAVMARRAGSRRLQLRGLTLEATAAVLDATAKRCVAPGVSAAIHARAEGNPFYAIELSRLVDEEGGLGGEVPGGVGDVIRRRLARLPSGTVDLLGVAAVVGRDVEVNLLSAAAGEVLDAVLDGLEPAVVHRVLVAVPDLPSTLRFSHALVREVLLEDMTSLRRARLHLRVAEAMEAAGAGVDDIEILAEHLVRAAPVGVGRRAAEALEGAAAVALRRVSYDAAEDLLAKAAQLRRSTSHSPSDQEAELLTICRVLEVARARRYFQGAARMDLIDRAKELAERCDRRDLFLNMLRFEWSALGTACQGALAAPLAKAFYDMTVDDPRLAVRANGHEMLGVLYWGAGRIADAVEHLDVAVDLFKQAPESGDDGLISEVRLLSHTFWAFNHAAHGDIPAEDAFARFGALIALYSDPFAVATICGFAATTANALGRFDEVERFVGISRAADPAGQFAFWVAQSLMQAAIVDAWRGRIDEALASFAEGKARYSGIGARTGLSGFEASVAMNLADRGAIDQALPLVAGARAELEAYGERWNEPLVLLAEAVVAHWTGDAGAAAKHLTQAMECATSQGSHGLAERARRLAPGLDLDA